MLGFPGTPRRVRYQGSVVQTPQRLAEAAAVTVPGPEGPKAASSPKRQPFQHSCPKPLPEPEPGICPPSQVELSSPVVGRVPRISNTVRPFLAQVQCSLFSLESEKWVEPARLSPDLGVGKVRGTQCPAGFALGLRTLNGRSGRKLGGLPGTLGKGHDLSVSRSPRLRTRSWGRQCL